MEFGKNIAIDVYGVDGVLVTGLSVILGTQDIYPFITPLVDGIDHTDLYITDLQNPIFLIVILFPLFKFKQRLLYKASVTGTNVHLCNESYTTKTCGKCGNLENIG